MKLYTTLGALLILGSFATGCSSGTPVEPTTPDPTNSDSSDTGSSDTDSSNADATCGEHAANSPEHCECLGGYVKGDIGDGKVACTDGEKELERTKQGIEGAVCCQKAEPAPESVGESAPEEGAVCGTRGAKPCAEGQFCDHPLSANCGATDHPGTCKPIPEICTKEYTGVCGCDNKTYATRCTANAAGVSLVSESPCK